MELDLFADRLVCGTPLADLLAAVADGVPPPDPDHSASCGPCLAALDRLEEAWRSVRTAAEIVVPPPEGIEGQVLRRVRDLLAVGWASIVDGGLGRTSVSEAALALVAEHEAAGVPGVDRVRASRVRASDRPALHVHLELTVRWQVPIEAVAGHVRRSVAHRIQAVTGLVTERVDVVVSDVRGSSPPRTQ